MESFIIAEHYVPKLELESVAKAVLRAQDIRESFWTDSNQKYSKENIEAVKMAVKEFEVNDIWIDIINGWITHMWNDVGYWANSILEKP